VGKNKFFLLFATKMAVFRVFWQIKGLGPLGVKMASFLNFDTFMI